MDPIRTHSYMTLHREAIEETRRAIQRSQQLDYQAAEQARLVTENFNRQIVEPARRAAEQWREFQSDIGERARLAIKNFDDHIGEPSRRALEQLRQFDRAAFQPLLHVLREIQTNTRWELLLPPDAIGADLIGRSVIVEAQKTWKSSIQALLEKSTASGLWATDPALSARVTATPAAYSSFCESTIKELRHANTLPARNALLGSIKLADAHLNEVTSVLPAIIQAPVDARAPISPTPIRLYEVQRTELSKSEIEDPEDTGELFRKSPAAEAARRVLKMLKLITDVNTAAQLSGKAEILKPTNRMLSAYADLPGLVPSNQASFADFIDRLYWVFYEGAGKDSLRYLRAHGGPFDAPACEVIWTIKTLRNKWYRHDPDHGSSSDIRRSYRELKDTLRRFGFERLPDRAKDYRRIHLALVNELIQFLQKLRDALR